MNTDRRAEKREGIGACQPKTFTLMTPEGEKTLNLCQHYTKAYIKGSGPSVGIDYSILGAHENHPIHPAT